VNNFSYLRPATLDDALRALGDGERRDVLAGGTTMVDLMKLGVVDPEGLVDITGIASLEDYELGDERLRFGALARMSDVGDDDTLAARCPALTESLWKAASVQLRHAARLGGNILQRTRCPYFRDPLYACNKREPGSGCAALDGGTTDLHAILGGSDSCVAMYPGDWAQALIAFDAVVEIASAAGTRRIDFADLHVLPGDTPQIETALEAGEIVTAIEVTVSAAMKGSHYLKARDRESYAFANASAAVGVALDGDTVSEVRIALGGVASVPWRARAAEDFLMDGPLDETRAREAGRIALSDANPLEGSAYKIELGASVVAGALMTALERAQQEE